MVEARSRPSWARGCWRGSSSATSVIWTPMR